MAESAQPEELAKIGRIVAVGAVVVDRRGRVLLIRRGSPPAFASWTLPGGKVEPGELLESAVVRELREETSLRVQVAGPLGPVVLAIEGLEYLIHEYLVFPDEGAIARPGDDASAVRWTTPEELGSLGVRPDAVAVIERGLAEARRRGQVLEHLKGANKA
jgi:acetyl-CoA carboxylase carboxyl transferase subunit beta